MRPEDSAMVQKLGWIGAAIVSVVIGVCFRGTVALDGVFSGIKVCERQFFVRADPSVEVVMVYVPLVNDSSARDRLVGIKSSCQCVTTAELPHEILPGESWDLPLRIDSSDYLPDEKFMFELTLFLESGSAVPVQIHFEMADRQLSDSVRTDAKEM